MGEKLFVMVLLGSDIGCWENRQRLERWF